MDFTNLPPDSKAFLAPMAGVADRAFREICRDFGAAYTVTEMVSAKGLVMGDRKSRELMTLGSDRPAAIQLFGTEPQVMAQAAKLCLEFEPQAIDINMGCPAPKVANNGAGSALMKDPQLAGEIIYAVAEAVDLPVTVKLRKGWDKAHPNVVELAQIAEQNGAAAVAVHGRTREEMYSGHADWDCIRRVKAAVHIPVIGNGDVTDVQSAALLLEQTGCDAIMMGRGAMGNPWLFRQINAYLTDTRVLPEPGIHERMAVMLRHIDRTIQYKGERTAMMEARGHIDVLVPRGGAGLIQAVVRNSKVPVIETGAGNVHIYIDKSGDLAKAIPIIINAKTQRVGVCNAAEKLLVHKDVAAEFLPQIAAALAEANVVLQTDTTSYGIISGAAIEGLDLNHAAEEDWDTEYLALKMGIKVVSDLDAAIDHINTHSTGHTESIIAEDYAAIEAFTKRIDSAVVMVNASTRFTDGGVFGFGAELGISTQKMHARGPMGLREMTTTKWIGYGTGQVRA